MEEFGLCEKIIPSCVIMGFLLLQILANTT